MNTIEEVARNFSTGNFKSTYSYLSDNIIWKIIGDRTFNGKKEVTSNCENISKYFNSMDTKFNFSNIISNGNKVIIIGTAEFLKYGRRINFIEASDFYEFDREGKIKIIKSFCISES